MAVLFPHTCQQDLTVHEDPLLSRRNSDARTDIPTDGLTDQLMKERARSYHDSTSFDEIIADGLGPDGRTCAFLSEDQRRLTRYYPSW